MSELFREGILHPAGERAATFEVGEGIAPEIHQHVRSMLSGLEKRSVQGINEILPTYCTLFIEYDPMFLTFKTLEQLLREVESALEDMSEVAKRIVEIPTCSGVCRAARGVRNQRRGRPTLWDRLPCVYDGLYTRVHVSWRTK